jgi:cytochrome c oxidase subunit 2
MVPAGVEAAIIYQLFVWMTIGATVILVLMAAVTAWCMRGREQPGGADGSGRSRASTVLILGGGIALPVVVLSALLAVALPSVPALTAPLADPAVQVQIEAEQWWWRVRYIAPNAEPIELANELRLPRGERVQLWLSSRDVIHSFWIPSLAGKMDMVPGRGTHLALQATETGVFRGVCAEYCGASHARMAFVAEVVEPDDFRDWLAAEARPAAAVAAPEALRGHEVFRQSGCGGCHAVRGTEARGTIGPDLTHVGSRAQLGAGTLANQRPRMVAWLADPARHKPSARMPPFHGLGEERLAQLSAYLDALR